MMILTIKDLLNGTVSWSEIFSFLRWRFFLMYLDDEIMLAEEN